MTTNAIKLSNISYRTPQKEILKNINLEVQEGEILALLGHNGSGKSTIIDILTGDINPKEGQVSVLGKNFDSKRAEIGIVYDTVQLFPMLKVKEILNYVSAIYKLDYRKHTFLLEKLELDRIMNSMFKDLSKGERKRVGSFLAVMHDPKLLVMDEPTADLDPIVRDILWKDVYKKSGRTILFTTHLWDEAEKHAHKIVFIHEGRIISQIDTPLEFLSSKYIMAETKIITPKMEKIKEVIHEYHYVEDEESYHIFPEDKTSFLKEVGRYTMNFSVAKKELKDVYQFLIKQNN